MGMAMSCPADNATARISGALAVDLDGTLIRTDLLFESFWAAVAHSPIAALRATGALRHGRAALKSELAGCAPLRVEDLPYNQNVLDVVRAHRAGGGTTALVTAADRGLAQRVSAHLGLFDEVHGSGDGVNLKGAQKAEFLASHYGEDAFDYIGDSRADLPVWARARRSYVVDGASRVRGLPHGDAPGGLATGLSRPRLGALVRAMRPHQWSKNVLVFLPALAAHASSTQQWLLSAVAFVAFCLLASGVYLLNDLLDLASDRSHPRKRFRPFASGALPLAVGTAVAPGLMATALLLSWLAGGLPLLTMALIYVALSTAYSIYLKRKIILDICVLAGLYTIRIVTGSVATGLATSVWLLGFSMFFFLGLAAVKRHSEIVLKASTETGEIKGRAYLTEDLHMVASIAISASFSAVLLFALYINTRTAAALYPFSEALWLVAPVLIYWSSRMVGIAQRGLIHDDPIVFAFRDTVSRICFVIVLALFVVATVGAPPGSLDWLNIEALD